MKEKNLGWGGKRQCAGRKKTCSKKVPFNRRINQNVLNILKTFAQTKDITETEALESAIILQSNYMKLQGGYIMKIAIPTSNNKLCAHFGHCETFSFAEIDIETKKILNIETKSPEEGISCQSANWVCEQGTNIILAGGMGGKPLDIFARNGLKVITGCPEMDIKEIIELYLNNNLKTGENSCIGDEHHHCHSHGHGHCGQ